MLYVSMDICRLSTHGALPVCPYILSIRLYILSIRPSAMPVCPYILSTRLYIQSIYLYILSIRPYIISLTLYIIYKV